MPLHQLDASGKFVPLEETPLPGLESLLEDWIESNPHLLLEGELIAIIARQPRTTFGKFADLLGIDSTGATIIIELKRGETPRNVIAQAVDYAAWTDSLTFEELDEMAARYVAEKQLDAGGIVDIYRRTFLPDEREATLDDPAERITFNNRQRIVIVAESFLNEVEQTLRYLRTKHGMDILGMRFGVHQSGGNTILETGTVVGREQTALAARKNVAGAGAGRAQESDEAMLERVRTPFMRQSVMAIEEWAESTAGPDLEVRHGQGSDHSVFIRGRKQLGYYYAKEWLMCKLHNATPAEDEQLSGLSKPDTVKRDGRGNVGFQVATGGDLEIVQNILLTRLHS